jgi:hypothetical protein
MADIGTADCAVANLYGAIIPTTIPTTAIANIAIASIHYASPRITP